MTTKTYTASRGHEARRPVPGLSAPRWHARTPSTSTTWATQPPCGAAWGSMRTPPGPGRGSPGLAPRPAERNPDPRPDDRLRGQRSRRHRPARLLDFESAWRPRVPGVGGRSRAKSKARARRRGYGVLARDEDAGHGPPGGSGLPAGRLVELLPGGERGVGALRMSRPVLGTAEQMGDEREPE